MPQWLARLYMNSVLLIYNKNVDMIVHSVLMLVLKSKKEKNKTSNN